MINLSHAAALAMRNKEEIALGDIAGCFHCVETFDPSEIKEYTDEGDTVLCPKCGEDCVLGPTLGFEITKENLKKINEYWLKRD